MTPDFICCCCKFVQMWSNTVALESVMQVGLLIVSNREVMTFKHHFNKIAYMLIILIFVTSTELVFEIL